MLLDNVLYLDIRKRIYKTISGSPICETDEMIFMSEIDLGHVRFEALQGLKH